MAYSVRHDFFDGSSGQSGTQTSNPYCVADLRQMAISWGTDTTAASRLTLQSSNEDGFRSSIVTWSNVTGIVAQGVYTVDTGIRWLRAVRNSNESLAIVTLSGTAGC